MATQGDTGGPQETKCTILRGPRPGVTTCHSDQGTWVWSGFRRQEWVDKQGLESSPGALQEAEAGQRGRGNNLSGFGYGVGPRCWGPGPGMHVQETSITSWGAEPGRGVALGYSTHRRHAPGGALCSLRSCLALGEESFPSQQAFHGCQNLRIYRKIKNIETIHYIMLFSYWELSPVLWEKGRERRGRQVGGEGGECSGWFSSRCRPAPKSGYWPHATAKMPSFNQIFERLGLQVELFHKDCSLVPWSKKYNY